MKNEIQLRPLHCELNTLSRADGAAVYTQGNTSVVAAMQGPVEVKLQNLKIDRAHVECTYRPIAGMPTIKDRLREAIIRDTCESAIITSAHPRTLISIQVQELDDYGGLDACAINAACLALIIGGVPMRYTFAAVHCVLDKDDQLILDPDNVKMSRCRASFIFVFDSLEKDLITVHTRGRFSPAQLGDAMTMCKAASVFIFDFYRKSVTEFHARELPVKKEVDNNMEMPVNKEIEVNSMDVDT